jgi:glycosyltransferase involved in cell wall biosynthesis
VRSIESVLAQSFTEFEFFVVDDGSTDKSQDIISSYTNIYNLHQRQNLGVSAARNTAAKIANGQWLAFIDSDDEWLPHKLEKQFEFIHDNSECKIVHGEEEWIRNGVRVNPKKVHAKGGGDQFERSCELCVISPSTVVLETNSFFELGMFREDFPVCEDYDLWLKYTARMNVGFIEEPLIRKYGGHQDQLSAKYKAMDYYRVMALDDILNQKGISLEHFETARETLVKKCEILMQGYEKHQNLENFDQVQSLYNLYH